MKEHLKPCVYKLWKHYGHCLELVHRGADFPACRKKDAQTVDAAQTRERKRTSLG